MPAKRIGYKRRRVSTLRGAGAYRSYGRPGAFRAYAGARIKGRGGYWGDLWNQYRKYVPRLVGGAIGGAIPGGQFKTGWDIGERVSRDLLGWGAYRTRATAGGPRGRGRGLVWKGNVPNMHAKAGAVRITHKECIGYIDSTTAFQAIEIPINPGLAFTFPWLSGIARNFQHYDFHGLAFLFKPIVDTGAVVAQLATLGTITMASEQNLYAPVPRNTQHMLQQKFAVSGPCTAELMCPVEQAKKLGGKTLTHMLVRTNTPPVGAAIQFYDDSKLIIATEGIAGAAIRLGQLFVMYDVSLLNPCSLVAGMDTLTGHAYCLAGACTTNNQVGNTAADLLNDARSSLFIRWIDPQTWELPLGVDGLFEAIEVVTLVGLGAPAVYVGPVLTNAAAVSFYNTHTISSVYSPSIGGASITIVKMFCFRVTNNALPVRFAQPVGENFGAATSRTDWYVTQLYPDTHL